MHLLKNHDRIRYQIKKGHRKGVEVKKMKTFRMEDVEKIEEMLKAKEQLVLGSRQSSFIAARDVLDYYFNKKS